MKYIFDKLCNISKLSKEINSTNLGVFLRSMSSVGGALTIEMTKNLEQSEANDLSAIVQSHTTDDMSAYIKDRILNAMDYGKDLMADYATKRVVRGAGLADTERVLNKLSYVQTSLLAGSLYVALDQLSKLQPDDDIPQADINEFIAKLQQYLGL